MLRRLMKYVVVLAILFALGYGAWAWLWPRQAASVVREQTFQAELTSMEDVLVVAGLVKPAVTIDLRAEASGIVEAVAVKEGDRVAAGQELVRLDSKLLQSALDRAEANLRQAELQDAATRLELDEDSVELKRKAFDRAQSLRDRGVISAADFEQQQLELRVALRTLERAKRNIEGSQARIAQARAEADQARTELQHTIVRAPFDAFILRRMVEVGSGVAGVQSTTGGSVLMTLGDARQSAMYAKATAADARRLRAGLPARVRLDSDATQLIGGTLQSVSMAGDVDQSTRLTTFPVVIALQSQPPGGWVNVPAQAEIILSTTIMSVSIPERCVRADPSGRSYVTVRTQTGNRQRTVEIGVVENGRVQIRTGLEQGQTIVCRPL
jgi:HlyD family secretion protein